MMDAIAATILVQMINREAFRNQPDETLSDAQILRRLEARAEADARARYSPWNMLKRLLSWGDKEESTSKRHNTTLAGAH